VTVTLRGRYFSPLTGALVDGIPLKRAVSLANNENFTSASVTDANSHGEYEYLSSNEILLNFPAPPTRTFGTPRITLVTPEHTETINSRQMEVNGERPSSLDEQEPVSPMFFKAFDETSVTGLEILSAPDADPVRLRLLGAGFRKEGKVFINDESKPLNIFKVTFEDTRSVIVRMPRVTFDRGMKIAYRLGDKSSFITYPTAAPTIESIINPAAEAGKSEGLAAGGYDVLIRGRNLAGIQEVFFGDRRAPQPFVKSDNALVVRVPPNRAGAVYVTLFKQPSVNNQMPPAEPANSGDLKADGKAVFTYKDSPKKEPAPQGNKPARKSAKKQ
jgi:hypothetical protein